MCNNKHKNKFKKNKKNSNDNRQQLDPRKLMQLLEHKQHGTAALLSKVKALVNSTKTGAAGDRRKSRNQAAAVRPATETASAVLKQMIDQAT